MAVRTLAHAEESVQAQLSQLPGVYEKLLEAEEEKLRAAAQVCVSIGLLVAQGVVRMAGSGYWVD